MNAMEEQILELTKELTDEEMKMLVENIKRKIFKGGIKEVNSDRKKEAIERYFNYALETQM